MDKNETIERLCKLINEVNERRYGHIYRGDCVCGHNIQRAAIEVESTVIEYIEKATRAKLNKYEYAAARLAEQ